MPAQGSESESRKLSSTTRVEGTIWLAPVRLYHDRIPGGESVTAIRASREDSRRSLAQGNDAHSLAL